MRRWTPLFLCLLALAFSLQSAWGFALLGPAIGGGHGGDAWEQPVIGYGLPGDIGTPKNLGEEYRRNAPVLYYAYDANFLDFFGSNGVLAVDQAIGIMNGLTNVDSYSPSLSEFPLEAQHLNYAAQSLGLVDLRSEALTLMAEQMGLAEPERYTWTLHDRDLPSGGTCPIDEEYLVVQRNYDYVPSPLDEIQYSPYVNSTLYSFFIVEICSGPNPLAVTVPFSVDPEADSYTAVAGLGVGLPLGSFYTGLTRDDVAGLRYLMSSNNVNFENQAAGSLLMHTNLSQSQLLQTLDLNALIAASKTNDPGTLATNFPGLVVVSSSNYFTVGTITNLTAYFTNYIGSTFGSPPVLVFATNYTYVPETNYVDTFANVVVVNSNANTRAVLQTVYVTNYPGSTFGSPPVTNVVNQTIVLTNVPSGDFFIIPPGSCGPEIVSTLFTNVTIITNVLATVSTNVTTTTTNTAGTTNLTLSATVNLITYFTNHWFVVYPCTLETNAPGLYEGIENVKFVKADYDSLLGQYFQPITNIYTMTYITNSQTFKRSFERVVTEPDFLFSARDQATSPSDTIIGASYAQRNLNFDEGQVLFDLAGPGVINSPTEIAFDKVGDVFFNGPLALYGFATNQFLNELTQFSILAWGSFDGTTNTPVVYPNGASVQNLENQILVHIAPTSVPDGTNGVPYPATTFTATGGAFVPPFTWSSAPVSATPTGNASGSGLPLGLDLSSGGILSGTPTNNPTGVYDFTIQLTDQSSRSVSWNYSITIH
ncbi:MAG: putative Ig domain-containing protein [Verrucomicrobiota bacterium]|nr:putative Ig domain-containing protein [Verrucomicrobiota bacterium]